MLYFKEDVESFTEVNDRVNDQLRNSLNTMYNINDNIIYKSIKRFYDLCVDEGKVIEKSISG